MPILVFLFVLSGAAGLIYESVWARYISLLVGHSAYAQVIVLVIFLGGMALGSFGVGHRSERIRSPLLWYAVVEAVIAMIALVFHGLFVGATDFAHQRWLPNLSPGAGLTAATWSLAAVLILPQSVLLGATFPLMSAGALRLRPNRLGGTLGILYFANSFGAAVGALVGGFALIGSVGLNGTLSVAAALNLVVAAGVAAVFVRPKRDDPLPSSALQARPGQAPTASRVFHVLLGVSFVTAFSSFLYEIAWTRMLSLVHGSATHSFELMLSAFILGLACGALWISRKADQAAEPIVLLARLQWAMGLAAIATLPLYILSFDWTVSLLHAVPETDDGYRIYSAARYAMSLAIMLPATFFAGTTLPLITRMMLARGAGERAVGAVYGVNTVGSIVGAAVAALVLVPLLGLKWVLVGGGLIDIGVAVALLVWNERQRSPADAGAGHLRASQASVAIAGSIAVILGVIVLTPFSSARLASGVYRYAEVPGEDVYRYLFYRDGRTASVSVRQAANDTMSLLAISTNGKPDASMPPIFKYPYVEGEPTILLDQDMSTQIMLPLLVLAHNPDARHGAVVGHGSGITSHILLASPTLERLHTIEIEPEMIRGSRLFYPGNRRVFDDPRSSFAIDDARAFLSSSGPAFDFVVSEPSNPWVSGVSGLFTVEFYQRVKSRLRPDGVFVQWFHLYEIDDASVTAVLASIARVFPSYRIYMSSNTDIIIVASPQAVLPRPDWGVTSMPALAADLRRFPPLTSETLDAAELGSNTALRPFLSSADINSDYLPTLDLDGERLRFRQADAKGYRELAEMRLDVLAAIESRRRGFGTLTVNPTSEIARPVALLRGSMLRPARADLTLTAFWADDSLRQTAVRLWDFDRRLSAAQQPEEWRQWVSEFVNAENELHGGTAGVVDEQFYGTVFRFLEATSAPAPVHAAVEFYHGLAAWDFEQAVRAGDLLLAEEKAGNSWIGGVMLRRGTALAKLKSGDLRGARAVYGNDQPESITDRVIAARAGGPAPARP